MPWTKEDQKKSDANFRKRRRDRENFSIPATKICTKCELEKDANLFGKDKVSKDGLRYFCKLCEKEDNKKWKVKNWCKKLLHSAKSTSKKYNLPFDLDEAHILQLWSSQNGKCYWLEIDLVPSDVRSPSSPSIDRIDCDKGYTKNNIVLCSQFANLGRCDVDFDVFKKFCVSLSKLK